MDQVFAHHFPLIIKASRDKIPLNLAGLPKNIKWSSQGIDILRVVNNRKIGFVISIANMHWSESNIVKTTIVL